MKRSRLALASLLSVVVLSLAADPVAAQTSVSAELINGLNEKLLFVAIPITILVEGILIYTVYRFKDADEAKPTKENRRLEITWTVATAIVLLFVGVASYGVLANENVTFEEDRQEIAPDEGDVVVDMDVLLGVARPPGGRPAVQYGTDGGDTCRTGRLLQRHLE